MSHLMNTYARQNVAFVRGEGVWLWDEDGRKYLDALAGIAVNTLGYGHPKLTRALSARLASGEQQAGRDAELPCHRKRPALAKAFALLNQR